MPERKSRCVKRRVSGLLAFVVMFIYVFHYTSVSLFFAAPSVGAATSSNAAIASGSDAWKEIDQVICLIDRLPDREEIERILTELEGSGDAEAYEDYYAGLYEQVTEVYRQYQALTEEQKESVHNRDKLLALEWLWGAALLNETEEMTWEWLAKEIGYGGTKTICLTKDITKPEEEKLPIVIPDGSDITLDLNGHTLFCDGHVSSDTSVSKWSNLFEVDEGGIFTIQCGSNSEPVPEKTGTLEYGTRYGMGLGIRDNTTYKNKVLTYCVTEYIPRDKDLGETRNAKVAKYQIDLGTVGGIECSYVNNVVDVKAGGILNIEGGRITAKMSNRAVFADGGTVNMSGGYLVGNDTRPDSGITDKSNGGGILVTSQGQLNMSGGVVANNKVIGVPSLEAAKADTGNGGGICIKGNSRAVIGGDAMIVGNIANIGNGGGIYAVGGSSVVIQDHAMIAGNMAQATTTQGDNPDGSGGGIYIAPSLREGSKNTLTITGGSVVGNIAEGNILRDTAASVGGGGIFTGGDLRIEGKCSVKNNYAYEGGGGILIWHKYQALGHEVDRAWGPYYCPEFFMSGAVIEGNVCNNSEGGGIRCEGIGTIVSGRIENNTTNTRYDFGGGGIYVEMFTKSTKTGGNLTIFNAEITDNTAYGYGGGVAGCGKSTIGTFVVNGAAVYGNHAAGTTPVCGQGKAGDHLVKYYDNFGKNPDGSGTDQAARDYFCVGQSQVYDVMLGGGSHDWTGTADDTYILSKNEPGTQKSDPIEVSFLYSKPTGTGEQDMTPKEYTGVAGLQSNPSAEDIQRAKDCAGVIITGNTSAVHGGGIACNGILNLGVTSRGKLHITKKVTGKTDGEEEKTFPFQVRLTVNKEELKGKYLYVQAEEGAEETEDTEDVEKFITSGDIVYLKNNEFIEIENLPEDTQYTISELALSSDSDDYEVSIQVTKGEEGPVTKRGTREITGTIVTGEENLTTVTFTNKKKDGTEAPDQEYGSITFSKLVTGDGDKEKSFRFRVILRDDQGEFLTEDYSYTGSVSGIIYGGRGEIELSHDQSVTIEDLPAGTKYLIEEAEEDRAGYTVTVITGTADGRVENGNQKVVFENHKESEDPSEESKEPPKESQDPSEESTEESKEPPKESQDPSEESTEESKEPPKESQDPSEELPEESKEPPKESQDPSEESPEESKEPPKESQDPSQESTEPSKESPTSPEESKEPPDDPETSPADPETLPGGSSGGDDPAPSRPTRPGTSSETSGGPSETTAAPVETQPTEETAPAEPEIPVLPELPNPNDPDSPDRVMIMEEGVPRTYVKIWNPEEEAFLYIPEEEVPLFGLPGTGEDRKNLLRRIWWLAVLGGSTEILVYSRRKCRRRSTGDETARQREN